MEFCKPWVALALKYDASDGKKKKEEGRELVKDKRVVYVYHDTIDATGDRREDRSEDI